MPLACSLAVAAFPPRLASVWIAFRRPSGTTQPSDFSRPFAISFLILDGYRGLRGGREISPGKNAELPYHPRRHYARPSDGYRALLLGASSPMTVRLTALRFRSGRYGTLDFHQTPPRRAFTL